MGRSALRELGSNQNLAPSVGKPIEGHAIQTPFLVAFDLAAVDGEDIPSLPRRTTKIALCQMMPTIASRLR